MKVILLILIGFSLSIADVVVDKKTNLMWQDDSATKSIKKNWDAAKEYCKNLTLKGHDDWFLPTYKQLLTITDKARYKPAIKPSFENIMSSFYWSSLPNISNSKYAWYVSFLDGFSNYGNKNYKNYIRCARTEESDTLNFRKVKFFDKSINFDDVVSFFVKERLKNIPKPPSELSLVRDEFETSSEFNTRVKKTKKHQKEIVAKYKREYASAKKKAQKNAIKKALEIRWGKPLLSNLHYDADNGYFVADISFEHKKDFQKKVAIKVERKNARSFKQNFSSLKPQAIFNYDGSSVKLKDIKVPYHKKSYLAQFTDMSINDTRVAVNLKNDFNVDSSINTNIRVARNEVSTFDASKLTNFHELEKLLKKSKSLKKNLHKWLFVVGIENYEYTDKIAYARRSAQMFAKVVQKRLGVPKQNSFVLLDAKATQADIKNRFKKLLRRVKKGDTIYFYYNGHGVPVPNLKNEPYMLASNSQPDFIADEKFFALKNIYAKLSSSKAKKIIAVVDSCFSGVTDAKGVLKGVAATKMVPKSVSFDKKKMVVLMAGNKHQFSNGYDKKGYRLFSFFVMRDIIEGKKDVSSLYRSVSSETYETSLEEYGDMRVQSPTIDGNRGLSL